MSEKSQKCAQRRRSASPIIDGHRQCSKRKQTKAIAEYYPEKTAKSGFKGTCKACCAVVKRRWQQRGALTREELFLEKIKKDPVTGCWVWTSVQYHAGYGKFHNGTTMIGAHRWSYMHFKGPIPPGLEIDHLCRVRLCVNPDHLEAVTRVENLRRANPAAWRRGPRHSHCRRGHEFTPDNIALDSRGQRLCLTCKRATLAAWKAKERAKKLAQKAAG